MTHNIHFYADDTALCIWLNQHYNVYFNTSRNISAEEEIQQRKFYSEQSIIPLHTTLNPTTPEVEISGKWFRQQPHFSAAPGAPETKDKMSF